MVVARRQKASTSTRRKRTKRDYEALWDQQVHDNHLDPGMKEIDGYLDYPPISESTSANYDKTLLVWDAYAKKQANEQGKIPDPRDPKTLKHFVLFYTRAMHCKKTEDNPEGLPTPDTVRNRIREFTSAWNRRNRHQPGIPEELRRSMTNYINNTVVQQLGLPTGKKAKRPQTYFTSEIYKTVQAFNWNSDWHIYIHEGARVDHTNMINTHSYTSARLQEVCQARYRDLECQVGWFKDAPDIRLKFTREFCKGRNINQPEHPFPERWDVADEAYPALVAQPMVHWLANFCSIGALRDAPTFEDVLGMRPPPGFKYRTLEFSDDVLDEPVFPEWAAAGRTSQTRHPTSWGQAFSDLATRAGLTNGSTGFHAVRRKILFDVVNAGYSIAPTLQFASQRNASVLLQNYLGNTSMVDGVAAYHRLPARMDLVEDFQSATMKFNPGLQQSLSSEEEQKLKSSDEYIRYTEEIADMNLELQSSEANDPSGLKSCLQTAYRRRNDLFHDFLKEKQRSQKLEYDTNSSQLEKDWTRGHFDRIKHTLPKARVRLAYSMTMSAPPRSDLWKQAIEDLITLRQMDCSIAWQEGLEPNGRVCPVTSCNLEIASLPVGERWWHVFSCLRSQYQTYHGSAQFCFKCSFWLKGYEEQEEHWRSHIETRDMSLRYDPIRIRNAVVCAGHCPVCLWRSPDLSASKRLKQFLDKALWKKHVYPCLHTHFAEQEPQSILRCPDERCYTVLFTNQTDVWHHLQDFHSIPRPSDELLGNLDRKRRGSTTRYPIVSTFKPWCPELPPDSLPGVDEFAGDSSSSSILSDECASCFTPSWDSVQTPLSDLSFDCFIEKDGDSETTGPELYTENQCDRLLIDPMLLPADAELDHGVTVPLHENQYLVERLLGRWKYKKTVWFYLQWKDGSHSFEPEEHISEELRNDFEQQSFTGFKEGAKVKRIKGQGQKKRYVTVFDGMPDEWVLPKEALHHSIVQAAEARYSQLARKPKQKGRKRKNDLY